MKMIQNLKNLNIFFLAAIIFISCKKDMNPSSLEKEEIVSSSINMTDCDIDYNIDSVGYALCNLKAIGKESLINFENGRNKIYTYIDKQFDGETNVLLKTLIDPNEGGLPFSEELLFRLSKFENINGDTLYPQIYIPFYDELKESGNIGVNNPIIVPYAYQDAVHDDGFTGYQINPEGLLEEYPTPIDSAFASTNEVWVISLNESVDKQGNLNIVQDNYTDVPYGQRTTSVVNCRINKMTVREHKESWVGGKSEVAIRALLWTWNGAVGGTSGGFQTDYYNDNSTFDMQGKLIQVFKRDDVSRKKEKTINYNLHRNWPNNNYNSDPICFGYVVFEQDSWPTGTRTSAVTIPTSISYNPRIFYFRSADTHYSLGTFYNMPYTIRYGGLIGQEIGRSNNFVSDRSGIRFNTQDY